MTPQEAMTVIRYTVAEVLCPSDLVSPCQACEKSREALEVLGRVATSCGWEEPGMSARARVRAALAALTPGPWFVSGPYFRTAVVFVEIPGSGEPPSAEPLFDLGPGSDARREAEAIATLRNNTADALAEAEAKGRAQGIATALDVPAEEIAQIVADVAPLSSWHEKGQRILAALRQRAEGAAGEGRDG